MMEAVVTPDSPFVTVGVTVFTQVKTGIVLSDVAGKVAGTFFSVFSAFREV